MENRKMIAVVAHTKQQENGEFKRVKEQFIIPGETFSTAEDFVYSGDLSVQLNGDIQLESLKREPMDGILREFDDVEESWYKVKATTPDTDSEKEKNITLVYYVNASSVKSATETLEKELKLLYTEYNVTSTIVTKIVDVF